MQPIERYGLIALLFLVVTVVAVVLWDRGERSDGGAPVEISASAATGAAADRVDPRTARTPRVAPESTRGQPQAALPRQVDSAGRAGLVAMPTENLPAPRTGNVAQAAPIGQAAGAASQLDAQRAALESILALGDAQKQEAALRDAFERDPAGAHALVQELRAHLTQQAGAPSSAAALEVADASPVKAVVTSIEDPRTRTPGAGMGLSPMQVAPGAKPARTHVIQKGDTLGVISQEHLGTSKRFREILALNPGLDERRLIVGRTLVLPPAADAANVVAAVAPSSASPVTAVAARTTKTPAPAPAAAGAVPAPASARVHVVAAGDSLYRIAARHLGNGNRYREIAALNPGVNPDRLLAGQRLVLPAAAAAAAPLVASTPKAATAAQPSAAIARNETKPAPRESRVK